jgi:Arc/MetJ family transcription regulator
MRTTVTLDDDLVADAMTYSGITDRSKLIDLALDHYIKRMAAKRLIALGGTMPDLNVPVRYRMRDDDSPAKEAGRALAALGGTMPDFDIPPRRRSDPAPDEIKTQMVAEDPAVYRTSKDDA